MEHTLIDRKKTIGACLTISIAGDDDPFLFDEETCVFQCAWPMHGGALTVSVFTGRVFCLFRVSTQDVVVILGF